MTRPHIQIYTMQSPDEAVAVASLGVDHIGVTPADRGLPGEVSIATAKSICAATEGLAVRSALSVDDDVDAIVAMVGAVEPDILHLCGPQGALGPDDVSRLRRRLPAVQLMQAIAVTDAGAIAEAALYAPLVDFILLDSVAADIEGVGAAGTTHDWRISAEIVRTLDIPVILAGGLSPANVAEAVRMVRPWGVDSLTHTNRPVAGGGFRKDLELVRQFVIAAGGGERR